MGNKISRNLWVIVSIYVFLTFIFSCATTGVRRSSGNVKANGIHIEYDTFGIPSSPPLLLINGLGDQMIYWDEEFCEQLANEGFYVIRFDNRDTGLSTKFEEAGVPKIMVAITKLRKGEKVEYAYSLDDMADDAVGLLDSLGIKKAHICGVSMGAAIAQTVGYRHPSRVLSLIPIMGTTGNPALPQAKPEVMRVFFKPIPKEREAYIEYCIKRSKVVWGSCAFDEARRRNRIAAEYDRCFYPQGTIRQLLAIIVHGNLKPRLSSVTAPTLVIHGAEDPLNPVEGGKDIADSIPGAKLLIIDKMGHCLPMEVWPQVINAMVEHMRKVSS